jgi:hypothetical protein
MADIVSDHGGRGGRPQKDDEVVVHFRHLNERENANFKVPPDQTLGKIWDKAYEELGIDRDARDVLQAPGKPNPVDLMPHLDKTLRQAQAEGLCNTHFEIAAGTGGA